MALCLLFAALHEAGHIIPLLVFGASFKEIRFYLLRLEIKSKANHISVAAEYISILGGSFVNLLIALVFLVVEKREEAILSAAFAALNLLPVKGLDGGEILGNILSKYYSEKASRNALKLCGVVFGTMILLIGCISLINQYNPLLLLLGVMFLINTFTDN